MLGTDTNCGEYVVTVRRGVIAETSSREPTPMSVWSGTPSPRLDERGSPREPGYEIGATDADRDLLKGHQSGSVACQFGKNGGPKCQFHDVIIELVNGRLTFTSTSESSPYLYINRAANIEGCVVEALRTARKGHKYTFRVDLPPNAPDSEDDLEYVVVSVDTPEEAERWMSIFGTYTANSSAPRVRKP